MTDARDWRAAAALACLMVMLPFDWIEVTRVAGFAIKLPYIGALIVLAGVAVSSPIKAALMTALGAAGWILVPYLVYLLVAFIGLYGSEGQGMIYRQVFFMTTGFAVAASVICAARDTRALRFAAIGGLVMFLVVTEVLARSVGQSWFTALPKFLTTGNLNFIIYDFFRAMFNALAPGDEIVVGAAEKNDVAVSLLTLVLVLRATAARGGPDRLGRWVTAAFLLLLVMFNTRSVLMVAGMALPLAWGIAALRDGLRNVTLFVIAGVMALVFAIAALVFVVGDSAVIDSLAKRFSFDDDSAGSRVEQFSWAIGRIEGAWMTGAGYAEIGGHPVHNLFLGAWMHAGIAAFVLVCASYGIAVTVWVRFAYRAVARPEEWRLGLRPEWVATLPLVGFFRVWISGDAGHANFAEWIGFGFFCGILIANALTPAPMAETSTRGRS